MTLSDVRCLHAEATRDTLVRIDTRLRSMLHETRRMLDGHGGSAYSIERTIRSIQADVHRLQRRHKPRERASGGNG